MSFDRDFTSSNYLRRRLVGSQTRFLQFMDTDPIKNSRSLANMQELRGERNVVLFLIPLMLTRAAQLFFIINQDIRSDP